MIVKLFGGPKHGKRIELPVAELLWVRCEGGHYAPMYGGRGDEYYWRDFSPPIAYERFGMLHPIQDYEHDKAA